MGLGPAEVAASWPAGYDDELTAIVTDPRMRWHARRLAGDLAEDLLQETWYAVARASARRTIDNLRGYFSRVMVNTAKRMREDIARQGVPVGRPGRGGRAPPRPGTSRGVGGGRCPAPPA